MVHIKQVTLRVDDLHRAARFWTAALDYEVRGGEIGDKSPVLIPKGGEGVMVMLNTGDQTHLDVFVADHAEQQAEVERLVSLGASRVPWDYPEDAKHVVLADPDGNLFCVVIE